jgi:hypothetical protein
VSLISSNLCTVFALQENSRSTLRISSPSSNTPGHVTPRLWVLRELLSPPCGMYRSYSKLRTRTAPRVVRRAYTWAYGRTPGRCVSLISSNPCTCRTTTSFQGASASVCLLATHSGRLAHNERHRKGTGRFSGATNS